MRVEQEHRERIKKKEYQVKQLREQLAERDRKLQDASTRINALETTLVRLSFLFFFSQLSNKLSHSLIEAKLL